MEQHDGSLGAYGAYMGKGAVGQVSWRSMYVCGTRGVDDNAWATAPLYKHCGRGKLMLAPDASRCHYWEAGRVSGVPLLFVKSAVAYSGLGTP